jgi:hypothetical protein
MKTTTKRLLLAATAFAVAGATSLALLGPVESPLVQRTKLSAPRARGPEVGPSIVRPLARVQTVQPQPHSAAPPPAPSGPRWFPRAPDEWQGMYVDLDMAPSCNESVDCGLALACVKGHCTACRRDDDCARGEGCSIDHCLPLNALECRRRGDCDEHHLCMLSGISPDPRGNETMRSTCVAIGAPPEPAPAPTDIAPIGPPNPNPSAGPPLADEELLSAARNVRREE